MFFFSFIGNIIKPWYILYTWFNSQFLGYGQYNTLAYPININQLQDNKFVITYNHFVLNDNDGTIFLTYFSHIKKTKLLFYRLKQVFTTHCVS